MGSGKARQWRTVPNLFSLARLLGAPVAVALASSGARTSFFVLVLVLLGTDWVDGKLARLLDQRSDFGARLDTASDLTTYAALGVGVWLLEPEAVVAARWWLGGALLSYLVVVSVSLGRFGRWPSFHTRGAKLSWLLTVVATIALLGLGIGWPVRLAAAVVILANLEALAIAVVLPAWKTDVPSLYRAFLLRRRAGDGA